MSDAPRATYRLQLSSAFTLDDAARQLSYLAELGVSHAYLSPVSTARSGSTHGYDVVDHNRINPELGGEAAWDRFVAAARENGLGIVVDIVPNHVGVGGAGNRWWLDVLEWGAESPYARHFDIQWFSPRAGLAGQLLVPFLGRQYGEALEAGDVQLKFDAEEGSLSVWLPGDHRLPIRPADYGSVLATVVPTLRETFREQRESGADARADADAMKRALAEAARDPGVAARIDRRLARLNGRPGRPSSFDALDRLIVRQHWRAASYRVASDDINYRRFFNINDLAGVRVEEQAVFDELHAMILGRHRAGEIDGLRIDHVDGLHDPGEYCRRLREATGPECYIAVEKILAAHESLPDWPVQGTTGYDFAASALNLFVAEEAAGDFTRIYREFTGDAPDYDVLVADCKRRVMRRELASELAVLARQARNIALTHRRSRDFTLASLSEVLREIVAWFPVYRSYVSAAGASETDHRHIRWAIGRARRQLTDFDETLFGFLGELMLGRIDGQPDEAALAFAMKLQQYTGPVMAKGMEDTAFYRYHRLIALNEVGSRPAAFGLTPSAFHQEMQRRAAQWPAAMLAGTTHDTKRGEDGRARLAALTGFAAEWEQQVRAASRLIRARRGVIDADPLPDCVDEYYLLQTLLAAWPDEYLESPPSAEDPGWEEFGRRVEGASLKAARESGRHTTWSTPDAEYENALKGWIAAALDLSRPNLFVEAFRPFVARVAAAGRQVALGQVALRLTAPGVPDLYQGSEHWELSMVDPDNRRPVDFDARRRSLQERSHPKQRLIAELLALRRRLPDVFARGSWIPVEVEGPAVGGVLAFERRHGEVRLLVVIALRPALVDGSQGSVLADSGLRLDPPAGPTGLAEWLGPDRPVAFQQL